MLQTQRSRSEIIEQLDLIQMQHPRNRRSIKHPGKIFGVERTIDNHSGQAEPCRFNFRRTCTLIETLRSLEKISDEILESRVISSRKAELENGTKAGPVLSEQTKITFRSPDIACQNHCVMGSRAAHPRNSQLRFCIRNFRRLRKSEGKGVYCAV